MKRFRLISIVGSAWCIGLPLCAGTSRGEEPAPPPPTQPARQDAVSGLLSRVRQAAAELKLSSDQKEKLNAMLGKAGADLQSSAEKLAGDAQGRAKEAQAVLERLRQEMSGLLSDEQKEDFQRKLQALRNPSGVLDLLKEKIQKLDLSDEQKKRLERVMAEARTRFDDLRAQARAGSQDARDKLLELFADTKRKMESILTPAQLRRLRQEMSPATAPADGAPPRP